MQQTSTFEKYLPWLNWSIALFFCVFQFYLQTSSSLMVRSWMQDFHLDAVGASNLSAAFFYTYLFMQIPVGYFNDRFNPRHLLTLGALLVATGCLLLGETQHYSIAIFSRMLMGLGSAFGFVSMLYIIAHWFSPQRFTLMIGNAESIGMAGVALAAVCSAWIITNIGWRRTMFYSAILAFGVMILVYFIVREKSGTSEIKAAKIGFWPSLQRTMQEKQVWLSGIFGFFNFAIINAICSLWGVPFLRHQYHFTLNLSAAIISMILYGVAFGTPLNGWLSMRLARRKPILLVGSTLTTLALSSVIFIPHLSKWSLFILFFLIGAISSTYIQCFAISKEQTPQAIHGMSMALTNLILMISAPVLQIAIAALLQHTTYPIALGIIPLGTAISFCVALLIQETYCVSYEDRLGDHS